MSTRILSRRDIAALLDWPSCIGAMAQAFEAHALGRAVLPEVGHVPARDGAFHLKLASLPLDRPYVGAKLNGNFPHNPERHGLPTIQGAALLCDGDDGRVLAILDSAELTARRTAAATALAARHLARRDAQVLCLIGCGAQAPYQLQALAHVCALRQVFAFDTDRQAARRLAEAMAASLGIDVCAVDDFSPHALQSDLIVTCTSARTPFLERPHVRPGAFVAGVGADAPHKSELAPALLAASRVVADVLTQCVVMGDLHHALECGAMDLDDVHGELGAIVCGRLPGRTSPNEIFVFDSTGAAIQDVAAAAAVFRRAEEAAAGTCVALAD